MSKPTPSLPEISTRLHRVVTDENNEPLGKEAINQLTLVDQQGTITAEGIAVEDALGVIIKASTDPQKPINGYRFAVQEIAGLFTSSGLISDEGLVANSLKKLVRRPDQPSVRAARIDAGKRAINFVINTFSEGDGSHTPQPKISSELQKEPAEKTPETPDILPLNNRELVEEALAFIEDSPYLFDTNGEVVSNEENPAIPAKFLGVFSEILPSLVRKVIKDRRSAEQPKQPVTTIAANLYIDTLNAHNKLKNIDTIQAYRAIILHEMRAWLAFKPSSVQAPSKRVQGEIISNFMIESDSIDPKLLDALVEDFRVDNAHLAPYIARGLFYSETGVKLKGMCYKNNLNKKDRTALSTLIKKVAELKVLLPDAEQRLIRDMFETAAKDSDSYI